jgi:antitoxin HicB
LPDPPVRPQRREYSGKFNVRVPRSLHAALAREAEAEGVSLNQLVVAKLALHLQLR